MNEKNNRYYYNNNNLTNRNINTKNNSPFLSQQQNNYYYNTKINHLIFHEHLNNNQNHNSIQNSNLPYNSMCIKYDLLDSDLTEGRKIIPRNADNNSYYKNSISLKKSDKFKNMKIDLNETEINMKSNISTTRNKNLENSLLKYVKSGNITATNNNLCNKSNPFNDINQLKKKNNISNNENNKLTNNDSSQNLKNGRIKSLKNMIPKSNIQNNNTFIDLMSYKNINNNYFYNIQNNFDKSENKSLRKDLLGNNNIFLNNYPNINSLKSNDLNYKVPLLKNEKVGNNHIKSPYSSINQKINYNNKNRKSPEILIGKQNCKNNMNKNIKSNKISNNNENKKRTMNFNINNEKNKLNNIENRNTKRSLINNINIYNSLPKKSSTSSINDKNKDKSNNNANLSIHNKKEKLNNHNKNKINYYYSQLNKIPNKSSYKKNTLSLNNKIRKFCDLLEQLLYISFKNCFKIFIQKIKAFNEYNISKRALIIRRFESLNKNKKSNNQTHNNSFSQKSNINNQNMKNNSIIKEKIFSNNDINNKREKSPTKFIELQDNIKSSMMNINQDNYIQMFNEIFKKQRENFMVKTCRSPVIERNIKDSLDMSNNEDKEIYDKYKLNTNNDMYSFFRRNKYLSSNLKNKLEGSFNKIDSNNNDIKNIEKDKNNYKLGTENSNFIGNIFDDDNINLIKYNYSIDSNLKRNNSITKIHDSSDKINTNKNILLYSKPKLTKAIFPKNKMKLIYLKKNERNLNNNLINNFMSNPNKNVFSYPMSPNIKNKRTEFKDKNNSENKKEFKKNEIIVKNVQTKDKKLYVFIKYIKLKNYNSSSFCKDKLFYSHTDSISLISKYNNQKNIHYFENRNNNNSNRNIEKTNQKNKIINNTNSIENDDDTNVIYLINFLQNIYNDNKKTIIYNFWKNLKKINTNYILQSKMKSKKTTNNINEKIIENKNIIELPNYKNNNLTKIKLSTTNTGNKEEEENMKFDIKQRKLNINKKISLNKNDINGIKYNKSCNNLFEKNNQKNEENSLDNKEKSIDKSIKQEQLKKIKLAKLGKLFKNLEQENNIINTIKEQFLDWTKKENNTKDKRKYGLGNYNNKNIFNNELKNINKKNELFDEYKQKIKEFRMKLIKFLLKSNKGK